MSQDFVAAKVGLRTKFLNTMLPVGRTVIVVCEEVKRYLCEDNRVYNFSFPQQQSETQTKQCG